MYFEIYITSNLFYICIVCSYVFGESKTTTASKLVIPSVGRRIFVRGMENRFVIATQRPTNARGL